MRPSQAAAIVSAHCPVACRPRASRLAPALEERLALAAEPRAQERLGYGGERPGIVLLLHLDVADERLLHVRGEELLERRSLVLRTGDDEQRLGAFRHEIVESLRDLAQMARGLLCPGALVSRL